MDIYLYLITHRQVSWGGAIISGSLSACPPAALFFFIFFSSPSDFPLTAAEAELLHQSGLSSPPPSLPHTAFLFQRSWGELEVKVANNEAESISDLLALLRPLCLDGATMCVLSCWFLIRRSYRKFCYNLQNRDYNVWGPHILPQSTYRFRAEPMIKSRLLVILKEINSTFSRLYVSAANNSKTNKPFQTLLLAFDGMQLVLSFNLLVCFLLFFNWFIHSDAQQMWPFSGPFINID